MSLLIRFCRDPANPARVFPRVPSYTECSKRDGARDSFFWTRCETVIDFSRTTFPARTCSYGDRVMLFPSASIVRARTAFVVNSQGLRVSGTCWKFIISHLLLLGCTSDIARARVPVATVGLPLTVSLSRCNGETSRAKE